MNNLSNKQAGAAEDVEAKVLGDSAAVFQLMEDTSRSSSRIIVIGSRRERNMAVVALAEVVLTMSCH